VHPNDFKTYAVEHYWPKRHFIQKECDYSNLYYSCPNCNSLKGEYWPVDDNEPYFPNPCDHIMIDHVRFAEGIVDTQSVHGEFMTEALQLNECQVVEWRKSHNWTIRALQTEVVELQQVKKRIGNKASLGSVSTNISTDLAKIDRQITEHIAALDRACGTTL